MRPARISWFRDDEIPTPLPLSLPSKSSAGPECTTKGLLANGPAPDTSAVEAVAAFEGCSRLLPRRSVYAQFSPKRPSQDVRVRG